MGPANIRTRYYLGPTFVVEHAPAAPRVRTTAILLLPPLGYEDTCAYRPLRVLADELSAAGHVVLRVDWPMLGDGALSGEEADVIDRCVSAIADAAASLRARGFSRVAAVSIRAGGLLALASGTCDELVLWAVPASGKSYLREERAFHKMAARAFGAAPSDRDALPEGAVEAGGFSYSRSAVSALERLVAADLASASRVTRALLIEREGAAPATALVAAFGAAGTAVTTATLGNLGDLLENPYQAKIDAAVAVAVHAWFAEDEGQFQPRSAEATSTLRLATGVGERPWVERGGAGELSGIICEPAGGVGPGARWTLFFNAGGIRRAGPNRLWTRAARALAARGYPSLRFDVRDVGDSDGAATPHADLEAMYSESSIEDGLFAWEWLHGQAAGEIDVVGLCSGAFLGAQVAARRNVRRALLFNGLAWVWNDDARATGVTSHIRGSLFDARRWRRLLTGRIDAREVARAVVSKARLTAGGAIARLTGRAPPDAVAALLGTIAKRGTDLHLVSSEGDPSIAYLDAHVTPESRPRLTILPGVDHTIRPVWAHGRVIELIIDAGSPILERH